MRRPLLIVLVLLFSSPDSASAGDGPSATAPDAGPSAKTPPPSGGKRVPAVDRKDPLYGRVEGENFENRCHGDSECRAGGCSGEVCSAREGILTTCEMRRWPQGRAACGCVEGECVWYRTGGEEGAGALLEGQGRPCREGECPAGLRCIAHLGVAGPAGPRLDSCEVPCADPKAACPDGQSCVTLADGPARVCRASP